MFSIISDEVSKNLKQIESLTELPEWIENQGEEVDLAFQEEIGIYQKRVLNLKLFPFQHSLLAFVLPKPKTKKKGKKKTPRKKTNVSKKK